jgi:hypothetical protein
MQRSETNLTNVLMGDLLDAARTLRFQRNQVHSAPYEKVEIVTAIPAARRRRAATIPRALLAQKRRISAPYEAIEVSFEPISMVASGKFEAAWFASPDDEIIEPEAPPADAPRWMMIGGALLGAIAIAITLLTAF